MEYILVFRTKDVDQFTNIGNSKYIAVELDKTVKEQLLKTSFKEIVK